MFKRVVGQLFSKGGRGVGALVYFKLRFACAASVCGALLMSTGFAAQSSEQPLRIVIQQSSPETMVFDWYRQQCAHDDTPDEPTRVFRDFRGTIHLFATHEANRALLGSNFDQLRHTCDVVYQGGHADNPALYNDRQWLTSFATSDGRTVYAIVHNEYHGNLRPAECPSRKYLSCWSNALTFAESRDGGYSFQEPRPPQNLIAAPPYKYKGDVGRPTGYFQPTNIVHKGKYSYVMFLAAGFGEQERGICVARTENLGDPKSWRGWDGTGYRVQFENPYSSKMADPANHACKPVGSGRLFEVGSLTYDMRTNLFLMVTSISQGKGGRRFGPGVYLSTSADLINWSEPREIEFEDGRPTPIVGEGFSNGFFSLIDEQSQSLDFSTVSLRPRLYLYYVKQFKRDAPYGRKLVKRPVSITWRSTSQ